MQRMRRAIAQTNPDDAKARVEAMLQSGKLTMERFDELGRQAAGIMRMLGIS